MRTSKQIGTLLVALGLGMGSASGATEIQGALSPEAARAKITKLDRTLQNDDRLIVFRSQTSDGQDSRRCVAATIGHFGIITSDHCLEEWVADKKAHRVGYSPGRKKKERLTGFSRAHRDESAGGPRWAILETKGHSSSYFGTQNLERFKLGIEDDRFTLVGFAPKVKGGRVLAMQKPCPLHRVERGEYLSPCGNGFNDSGVMILEGKNVAGIARVAPTDQKIGGTPLFRLTVDSLNNYGHMTQQVKKDEKTRWAPIAAARKAAAEQAARERAAQQEMIMATINNALAGVNATLQANAQMQQQVDQELARRADAARVAHVQVRQDALHRAQMAAARAKYDAAMSQQRQAQQRQQRQTIGSGNGSTSPPPAQTLSPPRTQRPSTPKWKTENCGGISNGFYKGNQYHAQVRNSCRYAKLQCSVKWSVYTYDPNFTSYGSNYQSTGSRKETSVTLFIDPGQTKSTVGLGPVLTNDRSGRVEAPMCKKTGGTQ